MKVNKFIPIHFQKLNHTSSEDKRFIRVKIWLMHLQENYNGSYFSKTAVDEAIPTLDLTPILGFIEVNDQTGEEDFSDHRYNLVVEDGELKWKYEGHAYGVIPPAPHNNAKYEQKIGDDGIERTYLTVEALMWTKFEDAISIIERDDGLKAQSMELSESYSGEWKDDGLFHFSKFQFNGACILGTGVLPAMNSASIEMTYSANSFKEEISEILKEFKETFSQTKKEVNSLNLAEILAKYSVDEDFLIKKGISISDFTLEALDEKLADMSEKGELTIVSNVDFDAMKTELDVVKSELEQAKVELDSTKNNLKTANEALVTANYSVSNFQEQLTTAQKELATVKDERDTANALLNEYQRSEHESKAEEVISRFTSELLMEEDVADIRENIHDYSIDEIEEKLFARQGRKVAQAFTKDANNNLASIKFNKINKNKSQADFADIIAEHVGE